MASEHAINEMRKMPRADLEREVQIRKFGLAKQAIGVGMGKEKDTSRLKKDRRAIARMLTVLGEQKRESAPEELSKQPTSRTVPARLRSDGAPVGQARQKAAEAVRAPSNSPDA